CTFRDAKLMPVTSGPDGSGSVGACVVLPELRAFKAVRSSSMSNIMAAWWIGRLTSPPAEPAMSRLLAVSAVDRDSFSVLSSSTSPAQARKFFGPCEVDASGCGIDFALNDLSDRWMGRRPAVVERLRSRDGHVRPLCIALWWEGGRFTGNLTA